jgi:hypothetical protein
MLICLIQNNIIGGSQMAELAQALSRGTGNKIDVEALKATSIFCGVSLFLSLVATKTYGLDLSLGFF